MKKTFLACFLLLLAFTAFANRKLSPQTLHRLQAMYVPVDTLSQTFQRSECESQPVSCFIHFHGPVNLNVLTGFDVELHHIFNQFVTATIPLNQIEPLSQLDDVQWVEVAGSVKPKMDLVRPAIGLDDSNQSIATPYKGKGVVVGIIDVGFQYNHINFYSTLDSFKTLRIKQVYNQKYKQKYTTQAQIEAAHYDDRQDFRGHGTHVAGIAAGAFSNNSIHYQGIASQSDILFVSSTFTDVDLIDAITYIYNYADSTHQPAVINLSLGTHMGPHDGTSTFDRACDQLVGPGKLLVGAASNEGNIPLFIEQNITHDSIVDQELLFDSKFISRGEYYQDIDFWGEAGKKYAMELVIKNVEGQTQFTSGFFNPDSAQASLFTNFEFNGQSLAQGELHISANVNPFNQKGNVSVSTHNATNSKGFKLLNGNRLFVRIKALQDFKIQGWTDGYGVTFANGSTRCTVGEIGGTGKRIITVGAYATRNYTPDSLIFYSSKGPSADGRLKPDITAPGGEVASSVPNSESYMLTNFKKVAQVKMHGETHYWSYKTGTSMATPVVTGTLATWLQINPSLTPEDVKELFNKTALHDQFTSPYDNNSYGRGKINAYAGIVELLKQTQVPMPLEQKMTIAPIPANQYIGIYPFETLQHVKVRIFNMLGVVCSELYFNQMELGSNASIDTSHLPSGNYVLHIVADNYNETKHFIVLH